MQPKPPQDSNLPAGDSTEVTVPPAAPRHLPVHGLLESIDVATEDELLHEAALRDSCLRTPR
ncbi:hypothetical protein [Dyella sp. C9]|uniref:hypothetical protein n=1 Tax=Dyella sp. C9 TaxID=2202154 RepID=UPI000DEEA7F8|nr:hypothetical protein [Dyella sp. C9]